MTEQFGHTQENQSQQNLESLCENIIQKATNSLPYPAELRMGRLRYSDSLAALSFCSYDILDSRSAYPLEVTGFRFIDGPGILLNYTQPFARTHHQIPRSLVNDFVKEAVSEINLPREYTIDIREQSHTIEACISHWSENTYPWHLIRMYTTVFDMLHINRTIHDAWTSWINTPTVRFFGKKYTISF